jgi:hypothetical protein
VVQSVMMQELGKPVEEIIPPLRPKDPATMDEKIRAVFGIQEIPQLPLNSYGLSSQGAKVEPLPDQTDAGAEDAVAQPAPTSQPAGGQ